MGQIVILVGKIVILEGQMVIQAGCPSTMENPCGTSGYPCGKDGYPGGTNSYPRGMSIHMSWIFQCENLSWKSIACVRDFHVGQMVVLVGKMVILGGQIGFQEGCPSICYGFSIVKIPHGNP